MTRGVSQPLMLIPGGVSGVYYMLASDDNIIANAGTEDTTIILVDALTMADRTVGVLAKSVANVVKVTVRTNTEQISGLNEILIPFANEWIYFYSNGANWFVMLPVNATPSNAGVNSLDILRSPLAGPVAVRPKGTGDVDLWLFGLGSGVVKVNGGTPEVREMKGIANGYVPLNASAQIDPSFYAILDGGVASSVHGSAVDGGGA